MEPNEISSRTTNEDSIAIQVELSEEQNKIHSNEQGNIEEFTSSVPFLSDLKRSAPNGCEAGGTWGTTKYYGCNTCMMCLLFTCAGCGPLVICYPGLLYNVNGTCAGGPFGLCVLVYPQDLRLAYLVNGKVYDRYGDLLGKEEDVLFQPVVEELVEQTMSR